VHAVRALAAAGSVRLVVVAAPTDDVEAVRGLLTHALAGLAGPGVPVVVVPGGPTRSLSVQAALKALPEDVDVVLVHDAARPLVPVGLVEAVDAAVRAGHPAVVPALPVVDTVKRVAPAADLPGVEEVVGTAERSALRAVQTPQGFRRDTLAQAYAAAERDGVLDATDDAGLVERMGVPVVVVPGDEQAFKVTRPLDLLLADAVLTSRRAAHGGPG
jgi:2-C-methyl-D-erythritol 4-phosphate cytidylyltransferase